MQKLGLVVKVLDLCVGLMRECLCFCKRGLSVFGCVWVMHSAEKSGWVGGSDARHLRLGRQGPSQTYIEADGAGLVFSGPLLRGCMGARVPWGSCPASPRPWAATAVANARPGGSWSQDPPPRSWEQAPAGRGKGCESLSNEIPRMVGVEEG